MCPHCIISSIAGFASYIPVCLSVAGMTVAPFLPSRKAGPTRRKASLSGR